MVYLISDNNAEYTQFMAETIETMSGYKVKGIAVVILTEEQTLTGYWNMSLKDKCQAEAEIRFDTMDAFILANRDRYIDDKDDEG